MNVDRNMIHFISENWDDERKSQQVHDLIEAMTVELKREARGRRLSRQGIEHYQGLIDELQNPSFWDNMDHMLHFSFPF